MPYYPHARSAGVGGFHVEWVVLVKVVPDVHQLRVDPGRRSVVRSGAPLFLNPLDQRALSVARELRGPGEGLSVLSMGPPDTEPLLRELFAHGVERVVLVTDPRLGGSDTLATARALAAAVARLGADLVLAGRASVDAETAQVPPELAELGGRTLLTGVRSLRRNGAMFTAVVEREERAETVEFPLPAVVSVTEKIAKPSKPATEATTVANRAVERWDLTALGLDPSIVGFGGSPTVVTGLKEERRRRAGHRIASGTAAERADAAVARLEPLLAAPRIRPAPPSPLPNELLPTREFLVLVSDEDGALAKEALASITQVRRSGEGGWPSAVLVANELVSEETRTALAAAGCVRVYASGHDDPPPDGPAVAEVVAAILDRRPEAAAMIFPATAWGREVAGRVAARRLAGLVGDAVDWNLRPDGVVVWEKPAFAGSALAEVVCRTRPALATVTAGSFGAPALWVDPVDSEMVPIPFRPLTPRVHRLDRVAESHPEYGALAEAEVVLVVGMGVGGPDGVVVVQRLAERLGAAVGGTRRVIDAGWLPVQRQLGLTGRSLAPELAVLVGVSGSPNHLVAWRRAKTLLAINSDPAAPALAAADVGVVGRWEEILPAVVERLIPWSKDRRRSPP
ncbi:MAG: FAD-binding protein [Thermoplasmata archaeon]|nr:FAD-binding protein [Thermoplasmata archaeon]